MRVAYHGRTLLIFRLLDMSNRKTRGLLKGTLLHPQTHEVFEFLRREFCVDLGAENFG